MSQYRNITAEILKPLDKTADGLGAVLPIEVLAAEVVVLGAVAKHIEGCGEHLEAATARMAFLAPRRALMRRNWARR